MVALAGLWGNIHRYIGLTSFVIGIVTAALNVSLSGFTPIIWFLIAIFCFIIVVCTEVVQLREFIEINKNR